MEGHEGLIEKKALSFFQKKSKKIIIKGQKKEVIYLAKANLP
jgi:hypothetical protein